MNSLQFEQVLQELQQIRLALVDLVPALMRSQNHALTQGELNQLQDHPSSDEQLWLQVQSLVPNVPHVLARRTVTPADYVPFGHPTGQRQDHEPT